MKKQKWLALLLCLTMAISLVACGGGEEDAQATKAQMELPWGLHFGQTSEEFIDIVAESDILKNVYGFSFDPDRKDQDGYSVNVMSSPSSWDFLCSKTVASIMRDVKNSAFPNLGEHISFHFNDNKELYKFSCVLVGVVNEKGEKLADLFFPEIKAHCNEVFGEDPRVELYSNAEVLLWENDELTVKVSWEDMSTDNFAIYLGVSSKKYNVK